MGCDIHLYVERLNDDLQWEFVPAPADAKYGEWFGDRNYNLFAMLADVRNGRGFGGVDTGNRVEPISAPRGIPADASARYKQEAGYDPCCEEYRASDWERHKEGCNEINGWGDDGHSHSWFTARELHDVNWDQPITHRGVVTPTQYRVLKEKGSPDAWSANVWGGNIQHVSNNEMETLISTGAVKTDDTKWGSSTHYTQVEWTTTWRDAAGDNWFDFGKQLNALTRDDGRDVRIVFFFDN